MNDKCILCGDSGFAQKADSFGLCQALMWCKACDEAILAIERLRANKEVYGKCVRLYGKRVQLKELK